MSHSSSVDLEFSQLLHQCQKALQECRRSGQDDYVKPLIPAEGALQLARSFKRADLEAKAQRLVGECLWGRHQWKQASECFKRATAVQTSAPAMAFEGPSSETLRAMARNENSKVGYEIVVPVQTPPEMTTLRVAPIDKAERPSISSCSAAGLVSSDTREHDDLQAKTLDVMARLRTKIHAALSDRPDLWQLDVEQMKKFSSAKDC